MNFVCLVFELGDKTLTLSPMENLMVKCNHQRVMGYVRGSPNGRICKSTNGTVGTIFTNGNRKTLNVFLLPLVPMVPLVDHMVYFFYHIDQCTSLVFVFLIYFMYIVLFITFTFACMLIYEIHDIFLGSPY